MANAARGPPESRSAENPPTKAHQTASPAPAASDQDAATRSGIFGRAPPIARNGITDPWSSAAARGTSTASAMRNDPS